MKHDAALVPDPPRLFRDGTALERSLLHAARRDAVPGGARERMAAALGPVLADTPALPCSDKPTRGEWLRAACTPRAVLLGLVGAGITAYLLASLLSPPAAVSGAAGGPAACSSGLPLVPAPDELPLSASGLATQAASPDLTEGAPVLQQSAPQRRHRAPSVKLATAGSDAAQLERRVPVGKQAAAAGSKGTLLEEVLLLDAIRSALGAGELPSAARALGEYDRRFPRGELRNEKSVLAVDLLLARGQQGPAQARARELLEQPGMQRYAAHLRAIAESGSAEGTSGSGSDTGDAHIRARR